MVNKYGNTMDKAENADFKRTYQYRVQEADRFFQSREDFNKIGIRTYEGFKSMDMENEKASALNSKVMFDEQVDLLWELQARNTLIEFHNLNEEGIQNEIASSNSWQKERLEEIKSNGSYHVYPELVLDNFKDFIISVAITIMISVVLVISPLFIQDRSRKVVHLQYTSKAGRKFYKKKVTAGLLSSFLLITVLLSVYFSFYFQNKTSMFFQVPVNAFIGSYDWYDFSLGHYMLLSILAIYILGLVFALLAMSFSTFASSFIALIGFQIPIILAFLMFGTAFFINHMIDYVYPKWVIPTAYFCTAAIGLLFIILLWKREKKLDIVQ
ncbi:hypothetical protein [Bacillus sp. FJAT-42376]|uniref:hypothetical protein n=1 Tax=Bacillus sp. FJAT-42376 TaxID=2014076 RepID=UPI000F5150A5|nr:hypothetical protein [Bacillus sp. FJAT-42376]